APTSRATFAALVPAPTAWRPASGMFVLSAQTSLVADGAALDAAALLRGYVRERTGARLQIRSAAPTADTSPTSIVFTRDGADAALGEEGYELRVGSDRIEVFARGRAGFLWAVQSLRQLLPADRPLAVGIRGGTLRDIPRFEWRGTMLDVARHFFPPRQVRRVIDLAARYKLNRFHLHLTDDQGWRIQIRRYPQLTDTGAATEVGGGTGGFYTQQQFVALVEYAAARGVTLIPEIEMPGHSQAAVASLPWLSCDGAASSVPTVIGLFGSSLCPTKESTFEFVDVVIGEIAALTPGAYIHIGGDESFATDPAQYPVFVERVLDIVRRHGKVPIGWEEIGRATVGSDTIVQHWGTDAAAATAAAAGDAMIVLSPASKVYMDMKHDETSPLGWTWAGVIDSETASQWDPAAVLPDVDRKRIAGIEAPLWTELLDRPAQLDVMLLPRLPGVAELAWSSRPPPWDDLRARLALQARRWTEDGYAFTPDGAVFGD
ncbi:MAG: beta-N-acetylhexosaminidase, partial [Actinomycetota bacterium]|nr:beta-N-acetylhexosaminidase [Actinomycetota bacterium]